MVRFTGLITYLQVDGPGEVTVVDTDWPPRLLDHHSPDPAKDSLTIQKKNVGGQFVWSFICDIYTLFDGECVFTPKTVTVANVWAVEAS